MALKNPVSEQLCRVSLDGSSPAPIDQSAASANEGKAPLCDEYGRLVVVQASSTPVNNERYQTKLYLAAATGFGTPYNTRVLILPSVLSYDLLELSGTFISGGASYLQLHITNGPVPGPGFVPIVSFRVVNNTNFSLSYPSNLPIPSPFIGGGLGNALWIVASSNPTNYVANPAALFFCQALFGELA
jgi:hypothetical protein